MANVNVSITNWKATGKQVPMPQHSVNVTLEWVDDEGQARQHSATYRFPDILDSIPEARLKHYIERIVLEEARFESGVQVNPIEFEG